MSKKLIVTIIIAAALTVGFVLVAVGVIGPNGETKKNTKSATLPNLDFIPKTASLYFSPPLLQATTQPVTVDVIVETGGQAISGTQLELKYDPQVIKNVKVASPTDSFFGSASDYKVLFTKVDPANGMVSFTVAVNGRTMAKKGNGKVATLSFTVDQTAANPTTSLTFAPTTLVTIFGANQTILKEAAGLTVVLDQTLTLAK